MPKYILSPASQESLKRILDYSVKTFGRQRAKQYIKSLRDRMRELAESPLLGQQRDEIKVGYYSYFVESHTIYYRIKSERIEIIDVLHQSMEPTLHL